MALVENRTLIAAPIDLVYRTSQDYAVRYDWDPFPEKITVVSGEPDGPFAGTQVSIQSKLGMHMLVEFVQVMPPTRAAVRMIDGPWMLAKFAGSWIFQEVSPNHTEARFRYSIVAKPWFLRFVLEPAATLYFSLVVRKRLAGLKAYCESRPAPGDRDNGE
jgi:hypothetical protein